MPRSFPSRPVLLVFTAAMAAASLCAAGTRGTPRLNVVVNDVRFVSAAGQRSANINDTLGDDAALKTTPAGRAELVFANQIIARLPGNTEFSASGGTRDLRVTGGAVLLQTPRSAHGARLCDGSIAVALSGTTIVFEHHPAIYKLLVLDGTARLYRPRHLGDSMLVQPGQMVIGNPDSGLSEPVDFDTQHFVKTCRLISDFAPLPTADSIAREGEKQARAKNKKTLIETNLVIFGTGTAVSLVDPGKLPDAGNAKAPAGPTPAAPLLSKDPNSLGAVDAARAISR